MFIKTSPEMYLWTRKNRLNFLEVIRFRVRIQEFFELFFYTARSGIFNIWSCLWKTRCGFI